MLVRLVTLEPLDQRDQQELREQLARLALPGLQEVRAHKVIRETQVILARQDSQEILVP